MSRTLKTSLIMFGIVVLAGVFMVTFMVSPASAQTATATPAATAAPTATPIPFTAQVSAVAMYPSMGAVDPKTGRPTGITAPRGDDPTKTYAVFGPGHTNVPLGVPVYVQAGSIGMPATPANNKLTGFAWTLKGPSGSKAAITKVDTANGAITTDMAFFTPDVDGQYVVTLVATDSGNKQSLPALKPSRPPSTLAVKSALAATRYSTKAGPATKHATAFTRFVNENAEGEYFSAGYGCARCHTVGYYPVAASTGGWWDVFNNVLKLDWFKSPLTVKTTTKDAAGKETTTEKTFDSISAAIALNAFNENGPTYSAFDPKLQAVSNIGCESCHGPAGAHVAKPGKDTAPASPR